MNTMKLPLDVALARALEPALASYITNTNQPELRMALETVFHWIDERSRCPDETRKQAMIRAWIAERQSGSVNQ